ncbi:hypothetical protein [Yinghuangia seranimata]|uniref:hypothetical protein n=1 Tax=Yinghuangia seranimata TaxID=408067 RepID=UPI00248B75EE|nr:hypothetical protein [Yinghuangia seranimata]MDI2129092.1 hypothetical protein [Yinghuangia seranimata]
MELPVVPFFWWCVRVALVGFAAGGVVLVLGLLFMWKGMPVVDRLRERWFPADEDDRDQEDDDPDDEPEDPAPRFLTWQAVDDDPTERPR